MTNHFMCTGESLSLEQVAKNQIRLNLCDLLQRQNFVAETKIFAKIFQYFSCVLEVVCLCDMCPGLVGTTFYLVCINLNTIKKHN